MKKIKRLMITSTALVMFSMGLTYCIKETGDIRLNRHMAKYLDMEDDDFLVCAHRGFSSIEVENTFKSISLASTKKYIDCIEVDVRMTKDGKLILSHDDDLINDQDENIKISNLMYEDILKMNFKYHTTFSKPLFLNNDEQIMINKRYRLLNNYIYHLISLSDGIKACGDKVIILDLKFNNNIEEFCNELKRVVTNPSNIIVQSFDIDGLKYLQDNSNFECMLLVDDRSDLKYINDFKRLAIEKSIISYDLMKKLKDNNIKVVVWTINNTNEVDLVETKVQKYYKDIIYITNYPDLIFTRLNEKKLVKSNNI